MDQVRGLGGGRAFVAGRPCLALSYRGGEWDDVRWKKRGSKRKSRRETTSSLVVVAKIRRVTNKDCWRRHKGGESMWTSST